MIGTHAGPGVIGVTFQVTADRLIAPPCARVASAAWPNPASRAVCSAAATGSMRPIARGGMATVWVADDPLLAAPGRGEDSSTPTSPSTTELRARFRHEAIAAARLAHPEHRRHLRHRRRRRRRLHRDGARRRPEPAPRCSTSEGALAVGRRGPASAMPGRRRARAAAPQRPRPPRREARRTCSCSRDGPVKVTDFGIAKADRRRRPHPHRHGRSARPRYLAPEQVNGEPTDARTDVYALGLVLYEMLRRAAAVRRRHRDRHRGRAAHHDAPPIRVEPARRCRPALEDVVDRCLARDPADRYRVRGRRCGDALDRAARRVPPARVPGRTAPSAGRRATPAPDPRPRRRRDPPQPARPAAPAPGRSSGPSWLLAVLRRAPARRSAARLAATSLVDDDVEPGTAAAARPPAAGDRSTIAAVTRLRPLGRRRAGEPDDRRRHVIDGNARHRLAHRDRTRARDFGGREGRRRARRSTLDGESARSPTVEVDADRRGLERPDLRRATTRPTASPGWGSAAGVRAPDLEHRHPRSSSTGSDAAATCSLWITQLPRAGQHSAWPRSARRLSLTAVRTRDDDDRRARDSRPRAATARALERAARPPRRPHPRGVPAHRRPSRGRARRDPGGDDRGRARHHPLRRARPRSPRGSTASRRTPRSTSCAGKRPPTRARRRAPRAGRRRSAVDATPRSAPASTSTPRSRRSPRSSGSRWCCATCATSTTPRSPRCSTSRPAPCGRGSPVAGPRSPRVAPGTRRRRRTSE